MKINILAKKLFLLTIVIIIINSIPILAQCGCTSGAASSNFAPVFDNVSNMLFRKGSYIVSAYYRYGIGDEYYSGDSQIEPSILKSYITHYTGIFGKYGITDKVSIEADIGYYPLKRQDFTFYQIESSGLGNLMLVANYNIINTRQLDFSLGSGIMIPLNFGSTENVPQHLATNSGSYGLILNSVLKYHIKGINALALLLNRATINILEQNDYLYGNSLINSFVLSKNFDDVLSLIEIRNELRAKDNYLNTEIVDSGNILFFLSPKLGYRFDNLSVLASLDIPFYGYYYGNQLTNKMSFSLNLFWIV